MPQNPAFSLSYCKEMVMDSSNDGTQAGSQGIRAKGVVSSFVLSLLSLLLSYTAIPGLVLGIIGLVKTYRAKRESARPIGLITASEILSIVGIVFSSVAIVIWVIVLIILFSLSFPFRHGYHL